MTEKEQIARTLQAGDACEKLPLCLLVEVDHHVAAEDRIQRSFHRQRMDEIELLEGDESRDLRRDLAADAARVLALDEESLHALGRDVAHPLRQIDSAA